MDKNKLINNVKSLNTNNDFHKSKVAVKDTSNTVNTQYGLITEAYKSSCDVTLFSGENIQSLTSLGNCTVGQIVQVIRTKSGRFVVPVGGTITSTPAPSQTLTMVKHSHNVNSNQAGGLINMFGGVW